MLNRVLCQVYAGSACAFELEELEGGAEYLVRVCCVRGGQAGAWSGAARLAVPVPPPAPRAPRRVTRPPRALQPRHLALLVAVAFLLLAVLMAVLLERIFVEPQP